MEGPPRKRSSLTIVLGVTALLVWGGLAVEAGTATAQRAPAAASPASWALSSARSPGSSGADGPATNESTLVLFNDSLHPGDVPSVLGALPSLETFDPATDEVFVADFYSGIVEVVSGESDQVVATIPSGEYTNSLAYDPANNNIYYGLQTADLVGVANASTDLIQRSVGIGFEPLAMAADPATGNVFVTGWSSNGTASMAVINGSYGTVQATFTFGADRFPVAGPNGLAYDPVDGDLYVASIASGVPTPTEGNLTVVNGSNLSVLSTVPLPFAPGSITYVPGDGELYLGEISSPALEVVDPSTATVSASVTLPNTPTMLAYDPTDQDLFVGIEGNVTVVDTRTNSVAATFATTRNPAGLAYDPRDGDLYIADYNYNNVSVVNASSLQVVGEALLGAQPYNLAYDPADGDLYVTDLESGQLLVVNGTTDRLVGRVPLGTTPYGIAYDPRTKEVYVTDYYADNVSVVNTSTDAVVGYLPAGRNPWAIAYDGANGDLYVTNPSSNNTTVLDPSTRSVVAWLPFSVAPGAVAYDPYSLTMVFGEYDVGRVTVLNALTNALVTNTTVGSEPYTISVDPSTGDIFVGNYASDNVTVLGPDGAALGESVAIGVGVFGSAYDPDDGDVYVVSFYSQLVTVINASSATGVGGFSTGVGPVAAAVDPATGTVYVANYDAGSLTLLSPTFRVAEYAVTVQETGLAYGTSWWARVDGLGLVTTGSSVSFLVPNGTGVPFSVAEVADYTVAPEIGTVTVDGANVTVTVAYAATAGAYSVSFVESGLPAGTEWFVNLTGGASYGSTGASIELRLSNGSYAYAVGSADLRYEAAAGAFVVNGSALTERVGFREVTYVVAFTETGLPAGLTWYLNLSTGQQLSSTGGTLSVSAPNGSYSYSVGVSVQYPKLYSALPGAFVVDGGAVSVPLTIAQVREVLLTEKHLPGGTAWWANFTDGLAFGSSAATLMLFLPAGSWTYDVQAADHDYTAEGRTFAIHSPLTNPHAALRLSANFVLHSFRVTFAESGLPKGSKWCVIVAGSSKHCTAASSQHVTEPNGTYGYALTTSRAGYSAPAGTFSVAGVTEVTVTFTDPALVPSDQRGPAGTPGRAGR